MISVVIPVHNRLEMAQRAVSSVLAQDYADYELIVVDDGSTHDLTELQSLVLSADHKYIQTKHRGVAAARNRALQESSGEWICLLDSDDLWLPEKLAQQVAYHKSHPEFLISQTLERWFRNEKLVNKKDSHAQPVGNGFTRSLELCCISSSSVMFHRKVLEETGFYDEVLPACEDYDFWVRVTANFEIGLVPEVLVEKFGGHPDQLSKRFPVMDRFRLYSLLKFILNSRSFSGDLVQAAVNEALRKVRILLVGAKKHQNPDLEIYKQIEHRLGDLSVCFNANGV